jgi:hypothetical protein
MAEYKTLIVDDETLSDLLKCNIWFQNTITHCFFNIEVS